MPWLIEQLDEGYHSRPDLVPNLRRPPSEVLAEGRFPGDAAGLFEADGRGDDRLVGATLGGERDAGGRADPYAPPSIERVLRGE